ncbi:MAG: glucose-1-phosphate adenylyltransferase, partial [Planctomycetota bacterium]
AGSIVSGGKVTRSIIGTNVRINSFAQVSDSILFDRVEVGRHARIRRAIIDKDVRIPPGVSIGYDLDLDRQRGFVVSPEGIVVIGKEDAVDPLSMPVQV